MFSEQLKYLKHYIRAYKLQQVIMVLLTKRLLPTDIKEMRNLQAMFDQIFRAKVDDLFDDLSRVKNAGAERLSAVQAI